MRLYPAAFLMLWLGSAMLVRAAAPETLFRAGNTAYRAGDYAQAVLLFREAIAKQPSSGALQNLGNAEWLAARTGPAILAWEQARWLDPFNSAAAANLRFARKTAQLEAPQFAWYEVISSWLPVNWWAWISGLTFWLAVGVGTLPGILRLRKAAWQQAVAALALAVFLLSLPAQWGVYTRSCIGFVLPKDTPLRLTPTRDGQEITRLAAGEPARLLRVRGGDLLIRTPRATGWIEAKQFGLTCPRH